MWQAIVAFFEAWVTTNRVVEKVLPSEKVNDAKFEQKKPRLEFQEKEKLRKEAFLKLRSRTDLDIRTYVNYALDHLDKDDQEELISLLTVDVLNYRKNHPIIFKNWLKQNT